MAVENRFHLPVRLDNTEKCLRIEQFPVRIAQSVVDQQNRGPAVRTGQVLVEPFPLGFSEQASCLVHVKQRIEQDKTDKRMLDNQDMFLGNLLRRPDRKSTR